MFNYLAFGIPVISEIELPALIPMRDHPVATQPVYVRLGTVPCQLSKEGSNPDSCAFCNAHEMIYTIPDKIKFFIANGEEIIIEPIHPNYSANLIYFYSNCLAAILYQRNLIPFHVSGVFTQPGKVALFAAPSGTGKSTLAVKLQELDFKPFTDDTAVLFIKNEKCFAQASYPMMRLWQNTLKEQALLSENDKERLYEEDEIDKFGFSFHEEFPTEAAEVEKIVFLREEGDEINISPINGSKMFAQLADNVYRCHWIPALQKNVLQFNLISEILNTVPCFLATRPKNANTINDFPAAIKNSLNNGKII